MDCGNEGGGGIGDGCEGGGDGGGIGKGTAVRAGCLCESWMSNTAGVAGDGGVGDLDNSSANGDCWKKGLDRTILHDKAGISIFMGSRD